MAERHGCGRGRWPPCHTQMSEEAPSLVPNARTHWALSMLESIQHEAQACEGHLRRDGWRQRSLSWVFGRPCLQSSELPHFCLTPPVLQIPLNISIREAADEGTPIVAGQPGSAAAQVGALASCPQSGVGLGTAGSSLPRPPAVAFSPGVGSRCMVGRGEHDHFRHIGKVLGWLSHKWAS